MFSAAAVEKVGTVKAFGGSTAPDGWLFCDGSQISRTTYAALFAVIGTTYGAGDGSTTFNLPNLFTVGGACGASVYGTGWGLTLILGAQRQGTYQLMGDYTQQAGTYGTIYRSTSTGGNNANVTVPIGVQTNGDYSGLAGVSYAGNFANKARCVIKY